jgi:hypothetical protein
LVPPQRFELYSPVYETGALTYMRQGNKIVSYLKLFFEYVKRNI